MSKFLSLVEENMPSEGEETLTDQYMRFAEAVSKIAQGHETVLTVDQLSIQLNRLDGKLEALGRAREEDQELDVKDLEQVDTALATAEKIKAASDPQRPSRGVKKIEKSVSRLGDAVSKKMDMVSNALK